MQSAMFYDAFTPVGLLVLCPTKWSTAVGLLVISLVKVKAYCLWFLSGAAGVDDADVSADEEGDGNDHPDQNSDEHIEDAHVAETAEDQ